LELSYNLIGFFTGHPGRIVIIAFLFFLMTYVAYRLNYKELALQHWLLIASAVIWLLYAGWEAYCQMEQANIRIDLIFILPVVASFSIFSVLINIIKGL
jgi:hypothetical protein